MNPHILIVDDEMEIRETLAEALKVYGYRAKPVATALEAERAAAENPPDLIISDLQLEDSDGMILIEKLKRRLPQTPIILLTGVQFDPDVAKDVLGKTVSAYLCKTASLKEILATVEQLVGKAG